MPVHACMWLWQECLAVRVPDYFVCALPASDSSLGPCWSRPPFPRPWPQLRVPRSLCLPIFTCVHLCVCTCVHCRRWHVDMCPGVFHTRKFEENDLHDFSTNRIRRKVFFINISLPTIFGARFRSLPPHAIHTDSHAYTHQGTTQGNTPVHLLSVCAGAFMPACEPQQVGRF